MGKKKATKSKKLRPMLEQAIARDEVYCTQIRSRTIDLDGYVIDGPEYESYDVMFGADVTPSSSYWRNGERRNDGDHVHVRVDVYSTGDIRFYFIGNRDHMLNRVNSEWFCDQLEQIITLHKMGAYISKRQVETVTKIDYHFDRKSRYYKSKRS